MTCQVKGSMVKQNITLRKKCLYSRFILVLIFPAFSRTQSECRKNADQNNSEYGHFLCNVMFVKSNNRMSFSEKINQESIQNILGGHGGVDIKYNSVIPGFTGWKKNYIIFRCHLKIQQKLIQNSFLVVTRFCNFTKKVTPSQMLSCKFCVIFHDGYFWQAFSRF